MYKDRGVTDRYTYRQLKLALRELYKGYTEGGRWREKDQVRGPHQNGIYMWRVKRVNKGVKISASRLITMTPKLPEGSIQ